MHVVKYTKPSKEGRPAAESYSPSTQRQLNPTHASNSGSSAGDKRSAVNQSTMVSEWLDIAPPNQELASRLSNADWCLVFLRMSANDLLGPNQFFT